MNKNENLETLETLTISATLMSKMLGIDARMVRYLANDGIIVKKSRGRYILIDSIRKYIAHMKVTRDGKEKKPQGDLILDDERAKHEQIKRQKAEIELKKIQGQVHDAKDVEAVMGHMLTTFRTRLLNVPNKVAPQCVSRDEPAVIESILLQEITEVLEELTGYDPSQYVDDEYIELSEGDDDERGDVKASS